MRPSIAETRVEDSHDHPLVLENAVFGLFEIGLIGQKGKEILRIWVQLCKVQFFFSVVFYVIIVWYIFCLKTPTHIYVFFHGLLKAYIVPPEDILYQRVGQKEIFQALFLE